MQKHEIQTDLNDVSLRKEYQVKKSTFIFTFLSDKHEGTCFTLSVTVCAQEHNGTVVSTFSPQHEGSGVDFVSLCQVCMLFSCLPAETCTLV